MERFDEALALVCEAMGFSAVGYVRMNEGAKRDMWSMYSASLSAVDLHRMSEYGRWQPRADDELVHAVESAAFVDLRMYAQASHVFDTKVWRAASTPRVCRTTLRSVSGDAQVRSAGATFQAALKALQGKPDADGWRGDRCGHFCTKQWVTTWLGVAAASSLRLAAGRYRVTSGLRATTRIRAPSACCNA
jgi:hypothetical protein